MADSLLWRIKVSLQFTGWLQYLPNLIIALVWFLIAGLGSLAVGTAWHIILFWLPFGIGCLLTMVLIFDICTIKSGLHPSELIPLRKDDLGAFDLMRARRSCRSFQASRSLTASDKAELMECVGRQVRGEGLLGTRPIRLAYVAAPLTVWPVVGAHEFLVAIAPREYSRLATIDVGRCLQKVVIHATRMGVATCWIGPGADQASVVRHLGAERFNDQEDHVICVCAVGYASAFVPSVIRLMQGVVQNHRLPLSSLFFADPLFQEPLDVDAPRFSAFGRCYEACQWSPSSFNAQPTRVAAVVKNNGVERFDFCAATTSRYYAAVALGIWCANWETGCEALGIRGHFSVLTPAERGVEGAPELPLYDISWVAGNGDDKIE
mmetsp:Transcript_76469/g.200626  ORF Transcript_76469/g.200626 Transcript_76469/m.200626 type:complete len:378 (-) Transcript_76469:36-1169(-)